MIISKKLCSFNDLCKKRFETNFDLHWKFKMTNDYPNTLAYSTLIILFSELLKFSKIISSKSKIILKDISEYLRIFHLLKWKF
jgi:hypothetical protein